MFGFFALLRAAARELPAAPEIIVVFDGQDGATGRRVVLPRYKPPVAGDERVFTDLPRIRDGLDLAGISSAEYGTWEADDVMATLIAAQPGREQVIMSTDKDFYQLIDEHTAVLNTSRRAGQRHIHPGDVRARHGVDPASATTGP